MFAWTAAKIPVRTWPATNTAVLEKGGLRHSRDRNISVSRGTDEPHVGVVGVPNTAAAAKKKHDDETPKKTTIRNLREQRDA
mmetsp:Transcript_14635/g.47662  ORF Transcript_14635/g.47662 Transcript_14635/m.47662 type:complete len:82 (-) Transcript_14635:31-276(-)